MPYLGDGSFQALPPPTYPPVVGDTIRAADFIAVIQDLIAGLSNAVTRDGQSQPTSNLPMAGKKHTGVADAAADDEYASLAQLKNGDALMRFLQAGTGAVQRTYRSKLRDFISVLDFGAVGDGVADDTVAVNLALTAARSLGACLIFPSTATFKVSASLNFNGVQAIGYGRNHIHIQATSAEFNVITTSGNTLLENLNVHGGWDGSTAGLSGDTISIKAVAPAYPYNVHLRNCVIQYSKRRGIYWERGGYSSLWNVKCNASGSDGVEFLGNSGSDACTTVTIDGFSVFSDCPNGYGIRMTECINMRVGAAITEYTKGVKIAGLSNRSLSFQSLYAENIAGGKLIDWAGSSGIGFELRGSFGGGAVVDYNPNWLNQAYSCNSLVGEPALPPNDGYATLSVDGNEQTTSVSGSFTAASVALPPGSWEIKAYVQTADAVGGGINRLGAVLTTNGSASGINTTTGALNWGSDTKDYNPGAGAALRVQPCATIHNTTSGNLTLYLRTFMNISGTVAYRGGIQGTRIR